MKWNFYWQLYGAYRICVIHHKFCMIQGTDAAQKNYLEEYLNRIPKNFTPTNTSPITSPEDKLTIKIPIKILILKWKYFRYHSSFQHYHERNVYGWGGSLHHNRQLPKQWVRIIAKTFSEENKSSSDYRKYLKEG